MNALPGTDLINVRTLDSQRDSTSVTSGSYLHPLTHSSSTILSLGASGQYKSSILLRWLTLPDSVANGGTIISAKITLHPLQYHIGNPSIPLSVQVREIMNQWSSFTWTADSLAFLQLDPIVKGSFNQLVNDTSAIDIAIDTAMVRKWFAYMSSQQNTNIYGLLLEPTGATNYIRSFNSVYATSGAPTLTVLYKSPVAGSKIDTILGASPENTYLATGPSIPATGITVLGGLSMRGKVRFDVSQIPPGSIVNNAVLYLSRDSIASTSYYHGYDTLVVYQNMDTTLNTLSATYVYASTDHSTGKYVGQGLYLIHTVQQWVNHPFTNLGLLLVKAGEVSDMDLQAFRGAEAGIMLRPRLVVTYTARK